ncbi:MAG: hypothetical protein LBQ20_07450 [Rhodanobacter sp.]|jgi:hypothetical protein|nr:hypothetical protein [Rhodanobacter sp.]
MPPRHPLIACALSLVLALTGCSTSTSSKQDNLQNTLRAYALALRWNDFTRAQAFIDPKTRTEHPPTALELARFKQVQVVSYEERSTLPSGKDEVTQVVEIGLVNVNSQSARSVIDHQLWRYDDQSKHWWLVSGLPDISRKGE